MTMVNDATEAALGLLGLTGSIDFRTTTTIPLKRKPSSTTFSIPPPPSHLDDEDDSANNSSDSINCICGYTYDDGFSIACDDCSRWVHAACFDIREGEVPEEWRCWVCEPRRVDKDRAARLQRARQKKLQEEAEADRQRRRVSSPGIERKRRASAAAIDGSSAPKRKRRYSVNTQIQPPQQAERTPSTAHPPQPFPPPHHHHQPSPVEDEHIEIDEPSMHSYVHIDKDIVPHQHTRDKLKRLAQHWRGMTALETSPDDGSAPVLLTPDEFPSTPQTSLHQLPRSSYSHPTLSSHMNPSVRPPSYTVRTTQPIPSSSLIAPYTSTIIPSTVYLSDPLNSYAHLGMPKPFVHLMGPPLDLALDARLAGNGTRFVRSGCRPNAVLRPMLCSRSRKTPSHDCPPDDTLTFGVFALRDLKAHEEVVLGWEWDDGSVIHHLPALIDSPCHFAPPRFQQFRHQMTSMLHALSSTFTTCACGAKTRDCALNRLAEFVDGQTPPTPSPSPPSHHVDDPPRRYGEDDDVPGQHRQTDLGPLIGVERGFRTRERVPMSGGMSGVEMVAPPRGSRHGWDPEQYAEAGPSRLPTAQVIPPPPPPPQPTSKSWDRKGKARATDDEMEREESRSRAEKPSSGARKTRRARKNGANKPTSPPSSSSSSISSPRSLPMPQLMPENEDKLPPKFRKRWIHQKADVLTDEALLQPTTDPPPDEKQTEKVEQEEKVAMEVEASDDAKAMPPPRRSPSPPAASHPPPPTAPPPSQDPTSPSTSFANLSLLSPLVNGVPRHVNQNPQSPSRRPRLLEPKAEATEDVTMHEDSSILSPSVARRDVDEAPERLPSSSQIIPEASTSQDAVVSHSREGSSRRSTSPQPQAADVTMASADVVDVDRARADGRPREPSNTAEPGALDKSSEVLSEPPAHVMAETPAPPGPSVSSADAPAAASMDATKPEPPKTPPRVEEPPPPKVKLSLKDFALRKKKQREEESKASSSPVVPAAPLAEPEHRPVSVEVNPATPELVVTPAAPSVKSPVVDATSLQAEIAPANPVVVPPSTAEPSSETTSRDRDAPMDEQASSHSTPAFDTQVLARHATETSSGPDVPQDAGMEVDEPPASVSLGAKIEMVEDRLPSRSPPRVFEDRSPQLSPLKSGLLSPPGSNTNQENTEPPSSLLRSPHLSHSHHPTLARTISREDGEIFSPPPPKPLPLAPRAHSPPTHPRSFHAHSGSTSPVRPPPSSGPPRRPLQPAPHRSQVHNNAPNARPLPSGPRALRNLGSNSGHYYGPFSANGAPRAPSADRDRDHRMDWDRERGRGGSWGRGRGSSGWGR